MFIFFSYFLVEVGSDVFDIMIYTNSLDIERFYHEKLLSDSRGREADNPEEFARFFLQNESNWFSHPNIVLAEELGSGNLTWHCYCDQATTGQLISKKTRRECEVIASGHRGRILRFLEVYSRSKAHILEDITTFTPLGFDSGLDWNNVSNLKHQA